MSVMFEDAISVTQLIESHRSLVDELATLEHLAHVMGGCPGPAALENLAGIVTPLPARLAEHMVEEERNVYPALVGRLGSVEVDAMVADHREIRAWVERLAQSCSECTREQAKIDEIRWTLLVVIGLVNLHLRKEEVAYVGLLARQVEIARLPT